MTGESTRIASGGGVAARVAGAALGLGLAGGPLAAQAPGGDAAAVLAAMKGDLRAIVSVNEVYHAHHATYAKSVDARPGFHTHPGVSITFVSATDHGWAAKATGASLAGKSCVIYIGSVTPPKTDGQGLSGPEAVATCDRP
jgi:hypothetical protein